MTGFYIQVFDGPCLPDQLPSNWKYGLYDSVGHAARKEVWEYLKRSRTLVETDEIFSVAVREEGKTDFVHCVVSMGDGFLPLDKDGVGPLEQLKNAGG